MTAILPEQPLDAAPPGVDPVTEDTWRAAAPGPAATEPFTRLPGPPSRRAAADPLAIGLGWFSVALGLAEVAAPGSVARLIGIRDDDRARRILRAMGARELANGVALLAQPERATWAWTRVAGDAIDLAGLGTALREEGTDRNRTLAAMGAVAGVTALDVWAGVRARQREAMPLARRLREEQDAHGIEVIRSITINRPVDEVYAFWRDFGNLPRFMAHLEAVEVLDETRSRWTARAPAGMTVSWHADIVEDQPGALIAWQSADDADVPNAGAVRFREAPGGRGTELKVHLRCDPPAGRVGQLVAKLFGEEPAGQVKGDLRRFKQVIETGEVVHSDASIHRGMHPACPPAPGEELSL